MQGGKALNESIEHCAACPRLREYGAAVARRKRKAFRDETYWGRPVPNFGDLPAPLLLVGLAPAAHGANRTGRMFTGDRSGDWLYRALHKFGLANRPHAESRDDGLRLRRCAITAICHCAPPDNKPSREELEQCRAWLDQTFDLARPRVIVALGQLAWKGTFDQAVRRGWLEGRRPKFAHAAEARLTGDRHVLASYHPSQQNTFTGRLTEPMFDRVFERAVALLDGDAGADEGLHA